MPTYFHVGPRGLQQGQVIQPGAWGRRVRNWKKGGATFNGHAEAYILIWEVALEAVRRAIANNQPSRLDCVFGCLTRSDAIQFQTRRPGHQIYQIDAAATVPTFIADYDVITNSINGPFVDTFVAQAFRYWSVPPVGMREVLIGGPATVI
jgi:hypothetical protein